MEGQIDYFQFKLLKRDLNETHKNFELQELDTTLITIPAILMVTSAILQNSGGLTND